MLLFHLFLGFNKNNAEHYAGHFYLLDVLRIVKHDPILFSFCFVFVLLPQNATPQIKTIRYG